jgi:hypothetical protein
MQADGEALWTRWWEKLFCRAVVSEESVFRLQRRDVNKHDNEWSLFVAEDSPFVKIAPSVSDLTVTNIWVLWKEISAG